MVLSLSNSKRYCASQGSRVPAGVQATEKRVSHRQGTRKRPFLLCAFSWPHQGPKLVMVRWKRRAMWAELHAGLQTHAPILAAGLGGYKRERTQAEGARAGPLVQPAERVVEAVASVVMVQLHALQACPAGGRMQPKT
jgi:hypothetical protein